MKATSRVVRARYGSECSHGAAPQFGRELTPRLLASIQRKTHTRFDGRVVIQLCIDDVPWIDCAEVGRENGRSSRRSSAWRGKVTSLYFDLSMYGHCFRSCAVVSVVASLRVDRKPELRDRLSLRRRQARPPSRVCGRIGRPQSRCPARPGHPRRPGSQGRDDMRSHCHGVCRRPGWKRTRQPLKAQRRVLRASRLPRVATASSSGTPTTTSRSTARPSGCSRSSPGCPACDAIRSATGSFVCFCPPTTCTTAAPFARSHAYSVSGRAGCRPSAKNWHCSRVDRSCPGGRASRRREA